MGAEEFVKEINEELKEAHEHELLKAKNAIILAEKKKALLEKKKKEEALAELEKCRNDFNEREDGDEDEDSDDDFI